MIDKKTSGADNNVPEKPSLKTGLLALKPVSYTHLRAHETS